MRPEIIAAFIIGGGALIAAAYSSIILAIFTPVISITRGSDSNSITTIFDITNTGSASAKDLKLTVQAPPNVTFNHTIFSTERYTENKTGDPSLLELYVPRFVQGAGSLIRIKTLIGNVTNPNNIYTFYATYDQGSILKSIPFLKEAPPSNVYFTLLSAQILGLIVTGIAALLTIVPLRRPSLSVPLLAAIIGTWATIIGVIFALPKEG